MAYASVQHEQPASGFSDYSLHDDIIFDHIGHIIRRVHFDALCRLGMHDPSAAFWLDNIAVSDDRVQYWTPPMLAVTREHYIAIRRHGHPSSSV